MRNETRRILYHSTLITLLLCLVSLVPIALFWPADDRMNAIGGLLWGALIAQAGLWMICQMVEGLGPSIKAEKKKGMAGYYVRYLFYALCLLLGVWMHFSILTMLAGILIGKASLVVYSVKERKDRK